MALQLPEDKVGPVSLELFRAIWVRDQDLEDPAVIAAVLKSCGVQDGARLIEGASEPAVKARLHAVTDEAVARGVCGAPCALVGDLVFWGQDRLHFVEKALAGWQPKDEEHAAELAVRGLAQ